MSIKLHSALALLTLGTAMLVGCGEADSGAYAPTTVTVRGEDFFSLEDGAAPGEAAETGSGAEGGTTKPAGGSGPGSFVGRVVLEGGGQSPSVMIAKGTATKDSAVCAADGDILDESLLVDGSGGIANVFVFLEKAPKGVEVSAVPEEQLIFDQKNCVFLPHTLLARVDQPLVVLNGDAVSHNTHTFPKRNTPFNNTVAPNDREGLNMTYKKAEKEPVRVVCDIHPWMVAWHLPVDHQFAAVTAADGSFRIDGLPAGKYKFKIWHEKGGLLERGYSVTVKAGDETPQEISFSGAKFAQFNGPKPKVVRLVASR